MKIRIKNPIWGVPITFLDKYCPTQFEIVGKAEGFSNGLFDEAFKITQPLVNGNRIYKRLFIKRLSAN